MQFLFNFVKGIFIGAGAILPGISSGVLCIIFGIYEKLIDSILGFFKDIKKFSGREYAELVDSVYFQNNRHKIS